MDKLLELLKDGHARTTFMLAKELHTTSDDIKRKLEYMENMGIIKRVAIDMPSCSGSCSGCVSYDSCTVPSDEKVNCPSCMPSQELLNMGEIWEVVK